MNEGVEWIQRQLRHEQWLDEVRRRAVPPEGGTDIRPSTTRRRKTSRRGRPSPDA